MQPVDVQQSAELKDLGERLQQAIVLTRFRVNGLPSGRLRARSKRILDANEKLFVHVSQAVHATQGLSGFLQRAFNVSVGDLLAMTGSPRIARGAVYAGIAAVNETVKRSIDELAAINAEIDRSGNHAEDNQKAA